MNYRENREFVEYYIEHILIDLKPLMIELIKYSIIETDCECDYYRYKYYDEELNIFRNMNSYEKCVSEGKIYDEHQIEQIFFDHINKDEYQRFCEILRIDYKYIFEWYMRSIDRYIYYLRRGFVNSKDNDNDYFIKKLEDKYRIYFRDERRRLRNIERKKRKALKNKI